MDRQEIKFLLNYLESNLKQLNSLQHEFIASSKETLQVDRVSSQKGRLNVFM